MLAAIREILFRFRREPLQEIIRQDRDILLSLSQRGQRNRDDIQAMVEIFTKGADPDRLVKIAIRRRNDSNVHDDRLGPAHPFEFALLKESQELGLEAPGRYRRPRPRTPHRRRPVPFFPF